MSFVTINQKRSWRPPPYLFQPVLDFMMNAAPLALAAANPFLRLYVERNVNNGGFKLDGYQVTPLSAGESCSGYERAENAGAVGGEFCGTGCVSSSSGDGEFGNGLCAVYKGPYTGTNGLVVEEDGVGEEWVDEDEGGLREESSTPRLSLEGGSKEGAGAVRLIPFYIHGLGPSQSISPCSSHRYPSVGVDRVVPTSTRAVALSLKSNVPYATDVRDRSCLHECWLGAAAELSLCVSIVCKSDVALHLAALGAWWLSRYYGVSLQLHHMHPAQLPAFKQVQRTLFIKELQFEHCTLSEDFLQHISTCTDLLSLSIISCAASQEVTLRCIDSILRKGASELKSNPAPSSNGNGLTDGGDGCDVVGDVTAPRSASPTAGTAVGDSTNANAATTTMTTTELRREVTTNWYLSGVRSLGSLRRLRCLHILHTPLHESFLQAASTCSSLECLILHRCRGVRSVEPLQRLQQLQSLCLHGLSITDTDVLSLSTFPALRQLVLDECRNVTDLSFLASLRHTLERLFVPRTLLSNMNMQHIGLLDNLVELDVHSLRQLTNLDSLKELTSLRVLNVRDNLITDSGCAVLRCMPSLQRLDLSCCRCLTSLSAAIGPNHKWAQRLHSLNLSHTAITDEGLRCIAECTDLRYLNLSQCSAVQELSFLRKMCSLRWLHLGGTGVTDAEVDRHLPSARALRLLSLSGCAKVSSLQFATRLRQLEYLDLESTGVTDDQLLNLAGCQKMRFLSLQYCSSINRLDPLAAIPSLLELNVSMTAVGSLFDDGEGRRSARSESSSLASSYGKIPSAITPTSSPLPPSSTTTSAPSSPSELVETTFAAPVTTACFPSLQVLHLNGCSRVARLEGLVKIFPQLRVLFADRISVATPRSNIGVGFNGVDEPRRSRPTPRQRGVRLTVTEATDKSEGDDGESHDGSGHEGTLARHHLPEANKSASQLDHVLQQFVPQPPATPRPRTAHAAVARSHPSHQRGASYGSDPAFGSARMSGGSGVSAAGSGAVAQVLRLVVRRSSLNDTVLAHTCVNFTNVTSLDLTKCVDVQSLSGIEELCALRELFLTQTSVDNDGVRAVSACVELEVLRLTECRNVTDVNCLASLKKLRALSMERTQVTNQGFEGIGDCHSLQFLTCSECRYLADVNALGRLRRLLELHLELTDVRDAGIRGLLKCSTLQRVYFTRCQRLTTVGELRTVLPQLEVLDVYGTSIPTRVAGQGQQFACMIM
jgi:hypothetical protein